jgi:hypothetical protein
MSMDPRLVVVHNLLRIYRDVLGEPAPADLLELLERLERRAVSLCGKVNRGRE